MPLLAGKPMAARILDETAQLIRDHHLTPGLAVILVGHDPGSEIYVRLKGEAARKIGMRFELHALPPDADQETVHDLILQLNSDERIHGIILQLPLPLGWNADALIGLISPKKDADGFHPKVLEDYLGGDEGAIPVLPQAIRELLLTPGVELAGAKAVALVNSRLFGQVIAHTLEQLGLSVEILLRQQVNDSRELLTDARVVVSVCGEPGILQLESLSPQAIVVDAGITRVEDKVLGDVAGDPARFSGWVTPIPGGVGPLTIACLLRRTTRLAFASALAGAKQDLPGGG